VVENCGHFALTRDGTKVDKLVVMLVLIFNPLPLLFKSLLPGQEDCVFF
jgi:hypothetical protein